MSGLLSSRARFQPFFTASIETWRVARAAASWKVRVYNEGSVVWVKRLSYAGLEAKKLPKVEHDQTLRATMEKTLLTVEAAIAKGKIG